MPTFRCPSDIGENKFLNIDVDTGEGTFEFVTANYVGVWGTGDVHVCGTLPEGVQCTSDGSFFHNSKIRFADLRDGLSQTFVAGERSSRLEYSTWVGTVAGIDCAPGRLLGTAFYPPNTGGHTHDFSSEHPSGTHFLLGDGSVRLIAETIDTTFTALARGQHETGGHLGTVRDDGDGRLGESACMAQSRESISGAPGGSAVAMGWSQVDCSDICARRLLRFGCGLLGIAGAPLRISSSSTSKISAVSGAIPPGLPRLP